MTIQEYLAAEGLSAEEIAAIVGNPKQVAAFNKMMAMYDEGSTALANAAKQQKETSDFWEQKTTELQGSVNRLTAAEKRAAEAEARAAQRGAYLKSLKDQGYEVPDAVIDASGPAADPVRDPATGQFLTRKDFDDEIGKRGRGTAVDLVTLISLSNEYQDLYGQPYLSGDTDLQEALKAGKPMREFVRVKYNFDGKRTEKQNAASEAAYQDRHKKDLEAERKKWAEEHGSNGEMRAPVASKFTQLEKSEGFKSDSWKTPDGRAANRQARLKRFDNLPIQ